MESVRWMIDLAVRAGAERVVLNGSFVTDIMEPNDVDCVLLFPPERHRDAEALRELPIGLPFLEISMVDEEEFDALVNDFFKADRWGSPKAMIELIW